MASPLFFDDFRHGIDFRNTWVPGMPWSPIEGDGSYPAEGCFYVNPNHPPTATLSPFSIVGGALQIKVFPTPAWAASVTANKPYIGGLMTSKFQRRYGFYECVAQNPHGPGLSGAFWLYPEVKSNEAEIDVYEHIDGYVMQTVHDGSGTNPTQATTLRDISAWHTYSVDWQADTITFYLNGAQTARFLTPANCRVPMFMILQTNVGAGWATHPAPNRSTAMPSVMTVRSVGVWANKAARDG